MQPTSGRTRTPTDRAFVDHLTVYQDFAQNRLKVERYALLSKKIMASFPAPATRTKLVFLRRGQSGAARPIFEEEKLSEVLSRNNFVILEIRDGDLDQILATLLQAKLVVSMEGGHIAHCCFTFKKHCGLLVLQPSDRFTAVHHHWAARNDVCFGFVVGTPSASGYQFSTHEILRTVDLMLDG